MDPSIGSSSGISSITLNTAGVIYATPVTFSVASGAATGTMVLATQSANTFLGGPISGGAAASTYRALVAADIPDISGTYSAKAGSTSFVTAGTITTGTWNATRIGLAYGGTNVDLSATGGTGFVLKQTSVGGNVTSAAIVAADIPSLSATYSVIAGNSSIVTVGTIGTGVWQGTKVGLAYGGTNADLSAAGGTGTFVRQATSGAAFTSSAIAVSDIPSGVYNNSQAGAASSPAQTWSGSPYTGGTATTNFPLVFISTIGATGATTWSTAGTTFGINAGNGFTGNLIDLHTNGGSSVFKVSYLGSLTFSGSFNMSGSALTNSYNGSASQSVLWAAGTLYASGTATTNFPQIFSQPTGTTAVTTWNTAGTVFGANVVSGFAGNFIDFHVNGGTSVFTVDNTGAAIMAGIPRFNGTNTTGAGTALLGTNSPAVTNTAPYTWIKVTTSDGSAAYIPAWK